jgi:hypothetical protein
MACARNAAQLRFMNQWHVAMSNVAALPKGAPRRALRSRVPGEPPGPRFARPEGKLRETPISGLPEIGTQMRASRANPTCVDPEV